MPNLINRTVAMLIFPNWNTLNCLDTVKYDFSTKSWIDYKSCFYTFKHKFWSDNNLIRIGLKSTTYFDKTGKLKIIVWIWYWLMYPILENGTWMNKIHGLLTLDSDLQSIHFYKNIPDSRMYQLQLRH